MPRKLSDEKETKLRDAVRDAMEEVVEEEQEAILTEHKVPGTIVDRSKPTARKVPWTRKAMEDSYPMVTFTPEETIPITVNGVRYQLIADQPITVPSVIKDQYERHRKLTRRSPSVLMTPHGPVSIASGAGPLGPESITEIK